MKFFYRHQPFLSHARAALEYQRILRRLGEEVDAPEDADVAFLHYEPPYFPGVLRDIGGLADVYKVGFCVWEADRLPDAWRAHIALVDEIWTPSAYCYEVFSQAHPRVTWVPHVVVCPARNTPQDDAQMRAALALGADTFVYLNMTYEGARRKNLPALLRAFAQVAAQVPQARLVVKTTPQNDGPLQVRHEGPVTHVTGILNHAPLHALYALSDAYVSAHCAEGWGLPMSDAMLFHKPVVATAYSGNLDFMTQANSYLVRATEMPIAPSDAYYLFQAPMAWGYVDEEDLVAQMLAVYRDTQNRSVAQKLQRARGDIGLYDAAHVRALIEARIAQWQQG